MSKADPAPLIWRRRARVLLGGFLAVGCILAARAFELQVLNHDFLLGQGQQRQLRVIDVPAHRGMILDRNGEPLAISTPVDSVWVDPGVVDRERLGELAKALGTSTGELSRRVDAASEREFVYLQRQVYPETGAQVKALGIGGVHLQREYRRYYPLGEVASHLLGFTDIDDQGQEGVELAYHDWLQGQRGREQIMQNRLGEVVKRVQRLRPAEPGRNLELSIDERLQYLAYRELKAAMRQHAAKSGSAVVMDVASGEVLAMVNQPGFNPHDRRAFSNTALRNRAVTDVFEPGSTMKPFSVAAALTAGIVSPTTRINTAPGYLKVGAYTVRDRENLGVLTVTDVLKKSSNVGATRVALSLPAEELWSLYHALGFGRSSESGFPGEASGALAHFDRWREIEQATMSFGYGVSVTTLQLVRAYAAIAAGGVLPPVRFTSESGEVPGERVMSTRVAGLLGDMLEEVTAEGGTGWRAAVPGYRVAGKTGTSKKSSDGGYADDRYTAIFVGYAPASRARLAAAVVIDEPAGDKYYGGQVAAPTFARIMEGALRLLDIMPDDPAVFQAVRVIRGGDS